jgi:hypothetical protein
MAVTLKNKWIPDQSASRVGDDDLVIKYNKKFKAVMISLQRAFYRRELTISLRNHEWITCSNRLLIKALRA